MGILEGKLAAYERHLRTTSGGPGWELHLDSNQWLPQTVKELQQSVKHAKELLRAKGSGKEDPEPSAEEDRERETVSTHYQVVLVLNKDSAAIAYWCYYRCKHYVHTCPPHSMVCCQPGASS